MSDESINYDKSPLPPEKPGGFARQRDSDHAINTDSQGSWTYPSAAAAGMVEIHVPVPHGPHSEQRMHARDFPEAVIRYTGESLRPNPYPKSMPMKTAPETLWHFIGAARGLHLLDEPALKRMEQLAGEFEAKPDRQEYFDRVIVPYLRSMTPKRR